MRKTSHSLMYSSGVSYRSLTASGSGQLRADQSRLFSSGRRFRRNVDQISCQICGYVFVNIHVKLLSSEAFFQPKMQQISFSGRALPGPAGGAYSAPPETPSWIKRTFGIPHPRSCFAKRCKNVASKMQCTWYDSARTHWMSLQHGQNLHSRKKVIKYCTDVLCTLVKL